MTIMEKESRASAPLEDEMIVATVEAVAVADSDIIESSAPYAEASSVEVGNVPTAFPTGTPPNPPQPKQYIAVPTGAPVTRAPQTYGAAPRGRRNRRQGCCNGRSCCCITTLVLLTIFVCCILPAIISILVIFAVGVDNIDAIVEKYTDDEAWGGFFDDQFFYDDQLLGLDKGMFDDQYFNNTSYIP